MRVRILSSVLSTLVVVASITAVVGTRPAAADQVGTLQDQATVVAQKLVQEQLQVDAYQQQYSVTSDRVITDRQAIAQTAQQIDQDRQQIDQKTSQIRRQAIRSYLDYGTGPSTPTSALFSGNQESVQATSEYTTIAVGNITSTMDQLRTVRTTLEAHQASLRQQQAQDQSDQVERAAALGQANGTEHSLVSLQSQVTGQLATAVADEAANRAATAAAAVAAAQQSVAQRRGPATITSSSTLTPSGRGGSGTDPALNPFLQCVVQAESNGDYQIVSSNGLYRGAFQFSQSTWNLAAQAAGRPDLIGVPPNQASKADQDTVAVALYSLDGERPWLGDRCST